MWFKRKRVEEEPVKTIQEMVEFTLLDPRAVEKDIQTLINVAIKNNFYGVCVNPCNVKFARDYIDNIVKSQTKIVTVVGFPLGANSIQTKVVEAKQALADGADELDVVINIGKLKDGDYAHIKNELSRIVRISKGKIVKAIIETCYLTRDEIKSVCKVCEKAKVDFIKTSTGYGTAGARVEDVSLINETVRNKCMIKASGGIRTRAQAEELIRAGASRIGTSKVL
ncbi:MAG: deoxyribose-phosphate aldolase [Clostridia bacterium]|nr:deoxyribose-phosphate aldolase [Clostridia bacterium]